MVKKKRSTKAKKRTQKQAQKRSWGWLIMLVAGGAMGVGGLACLAVAFLTIDTTEVALSFPTVPSVKASETATYSALTGEVLADEAAADAPIYCIQTPNGTDGARPQAGLNQAGVVFEAIAEAGITRFAAIYQGADSAVIGPVRSLRIYYLDWDTPFDCTIVHAGGADDAIAALRQGGYKELDESYTYMYRGTYGVRRWNNLFTTAGLLDKFATDAGYTKSEAKGFARMTPAEAAKARVEETAAEKLVITEPADGDTAAFAPEASEINLQLGGYANFNVVYKYDVDKNYYVRGYASGVEHTVYDCPAENLGKVNPEDKCELTEVTPAVVVAMIVQESKAWDNYHESIQTIGSGEAYIFQNGTVTHGKWSKTSRADQIVFTDEAGEEVKLVPGQTFVTAVPQYGAVTYQ